MNSIGIAIFGFPWWPVDESDPESEPQPDRWLHMQDRAAYINERTGKMREYVETTTFKMKVKHVR